MLEDPETQSGLRFFILYFPIPSALWIFQCSAESSQRRRANNRDVFLYIHNLDYSSRIVYEGLTQLTNFMTFLLSILRVSIIMELSAHSKNKFFRSN